MAKQIALSRGRFAIVDDEDYERLIQIKWYATGKENLLYAAAPPLKNHRPHSLMMHRVILGFQYGDGKQTDHIDGNGLNNQRSNLRICNHAQNQHNQRRRGTATSKYKGVSWNQLAKKWIANIRVVRKKVCLGCFNDEIKAAKAYNQAALKYFGEFASLNKTETKEGTTPKATI